MRLGMAVQLLDQVLRRLLPGQTPYLMRRGSLGSSCKWLSAQLVKLFVLLGILTLGISARLRLPGTFQPQEGKQEGTVYTQSKAQASVQSLLSQIKYQDPALDTRATVFESSAARYLPRLAESEEDAFFLLDLERARLLGKLVSVSYCVEPAAIAAWQCTRCKRVAEFQPYKVVFDAVYDVLGYIGYLPSLDAIVVAFRGTDSGNLGNWMNNLKAWRANKMYPIPEAPRAMVHAGFYNLWTNSVLQTNLTAAAQELMVKHRTPRLFVTGHSMGGALATLCALDLKFKLNFTEVRVWTFGSPRVGNAAFQQLFNQHVNETWRFTHNRDVVPSLPPQLIGFHHVAREAWAVDVQLPGGIVEQKVLVCDGSGEDPSCHNSACMLGLCTSIADHLTYIGLEMYKSEMEC